MKEQASGAHSAGQPVFPMAAGGQETERRRRRGKRKGAAVAGGPLTRGSGLHLLRGLHAEQVQALHQDAQRGRAQRQPGVALLRGVRGQHRAVLVERSEEHTSELQSRENLVCRLLLEKKNTSTLNLPNGG